jgi:hypothetical protein
MIFKKAGAAMIFGWECMESAAPTDCFSADLDTHRQVIGTERHRQAQAFSTQMYHGPPFERINSRTAFAAFSNGRAVAMIIIQNSTAS